jgi:hypothetical protein
MVKLHGNTKVITPEWTTLENGAPLAKDPETGEIYASNEVGTWHIYTPNQIEESNTQATTEMYISSNLGYTLTVPEKWNEYGYKVEYKYSPKNQDSYGVESWEETFTTDFPDWSGFELITTGSVPTSIYYAEKTGYEEAIEAGLEIEPYGSPRYFWGEKLGETDTHVFYSYATRQDAPQKFLDDGTPMPDMKKDFKIQ